MIKINEIYLSIQGESTYAGLPTVFVRTSGCHMRCNYCDTEYAFYDGKKLEKDAVLSEVKKHKTQNICVTGGEPLLQKEIPQLMKELCDDDYQVSLETSGSISCQEVDKRVKKILDVKTPDSGEGDTFHLDNLEFATSHDEFKFVICSENDFTWAEEFCKKFSLSDKCTVLYSPCHGHITAECLAEKILSRKSKARLQLQLHKYIWSEHDRGI